jgi:lactoylglutathione lyase
MQPTTITGVRTIGVKVSDQDAATEFYVAALGFEKRLDAPIGPTTRWIEVAPPGAATSIALNVNDGDPGAAVDTGVRFTVPDAATEHAAMREHGVNVGVVLRLDGVPPMFTFDDPDGNRFYVVQEIR